VAGRADPRIAIFARGELVRPDSSANSLPVLEMIEAETIRKGEVPCGHCFIDHGGADCARRPRSQSRLRGITAIALDPEGKVSPLTAVWDGAMLPLDEVEALVVLSIESCDRQRSKGECSAHRVGSLHRGAEWRKNGETRPCRERQVPVSLYAPMLSGDGWASGRIGLLSVIAKRISQP
jgi:hypothetical protein